MSRWCRRIADAWSKASSGVKRPSVQTFVLFGGGKAAANAHIELGFKFMFPVESADHLLRVQHFKTLDSLDVAGGDFAFFVHGKRQFLRLVVLAVQLAL